MHRFTSTLLVIATLACASVADAQTSPRLPVVPAGQASHFHIEPGFLAGGPLPRKYATRGCGGKNMSPPLGWFAAPIGTKSYLLEFSDTDTNQVHWVVPDIPVETTRLPENIGVAKWHNRDYGAYTKNGFGRYGYDGPCPPKGQTHHYLFKLYALDIAQPVVPAAADVERVTVGHILSEATVFVTFKR
jgi:Raf kinase inhibitor-like YbhB/YbcL family protein